MTVDVADVEAARLELLASDYETAEERYATPDGIPVTQVCGWVDGAKDGEEADWSLRLVSGGENYCDGCDAAPSED